MERGGRRNSRHRRPKRSIQTTQKDKKFLAKFLPLSSHDIWEDLRADEEKKLLKSYILDPTGSISYYWTMVVCLAVVYHLWTVTFRVAFLDPFNDPECCSVLWILVDQLSTIIFVLDFVSQFRTSYLKDGMMESDPEELYEHYTTSFFFKLDLAAVIPFDLLFMILLRTTHVPSLVHLPKMLKVYRLREFFDRTEIRTHFPNACRMLFLTHNVVVIIHWNGCAYFWLCRILGFGSDPWVYPNWGDLGYEDWGFLTRQYIYSFYWSTLTLTTIGELPVPQTNLEFMFVTTNYLIGILLFASIVGNVGNIIVNVQKNRSKFQTKIDNIKDYMQQRKVPNNLQHRVIKFYNYMWTNGHPISNESVLASLPEKLRAEIGIYVHMDTLKKVAFFERCETSLLSDLVLCLKTQIYLPGDYVCRKGDVGHEMYIVNRGRLEVLDEDNVTVKSVLTTGSYFGEISILDLGETRHRRTANVRSVGYSDLLCLSQVDLLMVLKNYPKTLENLKRAGKTILEEEKNRQKKRESCCSTVHTLIEDFEKDDDGDSDSDDDMPRPRYSTTKRISQAGKQPHISVQNQVASIHTRMNTLEMTMQRILLQLEKLQENREEHDATEHGSETDKEGDEGKVDEDSDRSDSLSRDNTLFGKLRAKSRRRLSSQV